jgi:putative membrane protein
LVPRTVYLALRGRFEQHRRIARVTISIWLYVSATGVMVYTMIHHLPVGA